MTWTLLGMEGGWLAREVVLQGWSGSSGAH